MVVGGVVLSLLFTTRLVHRLDALGRLTDELTAGRSARLDRGGSDRGGSDGAGHRAPGTPAPEHQGTRRAHLGSGGDELDRVAGKLADARVLLERRAAERDAARRELEELLARSPVVLVRYDVGARRVTYASPNAARVLGVQAMELLGDPEAIASRCDPSSVGQVRQWVRGQLHADGDRLELVVRFDPGDGSGARQLEATFVVDADDTGHAVRFAAYLLDVTERRRAERQAEERNALLQSILDASPDTIAVRDGEGRVVLASRSLADAVGDAVPADASSPELVEAAYRAGGIGTEQRAAIERMLGRCLAGEAATEPVLTAGRDAAGNERVYETRARPVVGGDGRVVGAITISRDVTEHIRLEESLRQATAAAERSNRAKSEFLSRMSHELRTPLNAILGFAQLLGLDELTEEQASAVGQIERAGQHLLALINEVLDISRIETGHLVVSPRPVPVDDVLDEVASLLAPVADEAGIHLHVQRTTSCTAVHADRQRLLQVLLNLGSNAVKYNERGGSVTMVARIDGDRVRFEVADTGSGIPGDKLDQLFVPFSRLGAERSGVEGTGVGLALSKHLVELMGGSIGVDSAPGRGSTFWIELLAAAPDAPGAGGERRPDPLDQPLATPGTTNGARSPRPRPVAARDPGGEEPPGARTAWRGGGSSDGDRPSPGGGQSGGDGASERAREPDEAGTRGGTGVPVRTAGPELVVLHVEDNPSNANLVEQVLARRPEVHLVTAGQARLGLELARQVRPHLVLLDLHLPDLPGEELLYRLKTEPALADTTVVVVSADATPSRIRRLLGLGVQGYLTKPIDVEALLRLIDREIEERVR